MFSKLSLLLAVIVAMESTVLGASQEKDNILQVETPVVSDYYFEASQYSLDGLWGGMFRINADISLGVEWPWYSNLDYIANEFMAYAWAGAELELEVTLAIIRIKFYVDFLGARWNGINFTSMFNAPKFNNFCYKAGWDANAVSMEVYTEVDINECDWGVLGFAT